MANVKVNGDELILELSFWERVGALHSSPRVPLSAVTKVEFIDNLWSNKVNQLPLKPVWPVTRIGPLTA